MDIETLKKTYRYVTIEEGSYQLNVYTSRRDGLKAHIIKATSGQVVFHRKVASMEAAKAALDKIIKREGQRVFLRKYLHKTIYSGHMSVFEEEKPDTYTVLFFRKSARGLSRRFREEVTAHFENRHEMLEFFMKVFPALTEAFGVEADRARLQEEIRWGTKVASAKFSIKETFLTKGIEI